MKLISLSSIAWRGHRNKCESLIENILSREGFLAVTIDREAVLLGCGMAAQSFKVTEVSLADWIRKETDQYQVDTLALSKAAIQMDARKPMLLEASGFPVDCVIRVLQAARQAWFSLPVWPPAFILVYEDVMLIELSEHFIDSFYLRPAHLSPREVASFVRRIEHNAFLERWFILGAPLAKLLWFLLDRLGDVVRRLGSRNPVGKRTL